MSFLKSLFSRWQRHGNRYQPVTNWVDAGEEEDDLMRMASEDDSPLFLDNDLHLDEGAVFTASRNASLWQQSEQQNICRMTCVCGVPSAREKISPCLCFVALLTIMAVSCVSIGLGYYSMFVLKPEPVIDKSIDSFSIPNHQAYLNFDALNLARRYNSSRMRFKRDVSEQDEPSIDYGSARLYEEEEEEEEEEVRVKRSNQIVTSDMNQVVKRWKMQVIYLAVGDDNPNVFTEERLKMIHKVEKDIVTHPRWREFCLRDPRTASFDPAVRDHNSCAPLNSLLSYFFPSEDKRGQIFYDGFGENLGDIESALRLAMNHESFYYFVDRKINKTYQKSHMLRTEVLFGAPLPGNRLEDCIKLPLSLKVTECNTCQVTLTVLKIVLSYHCH